MTPLPPPLGGGELVAWRLDDRRYAATWHLGQGAYRDGGRWNSAGVRAVYCSLDPATAILEVAVHKGFRVLDTMAHVLTSITLRNLQSARVVQPDDLPNPNWVHPGSPSAGQQAFGSALLAAHPFILIPSAVSRQSWNLIFAGNGTAAYDILGQEAFALDTRLHPPPA